MTDRNANLDWQTTMQLLHTTSQQPNAQFPQMLIRQKRTTKHMQQQDRYDDQLIQSQPSHNWLRNILTGRLKRNDIHNDTSTTGITTTCPLMQRTSKMHLLSPHKCGLMDTQINFNNQIPCMDEHWDNPLQIKWKISPTLGLQLRTIQQILLSDPKN